MECSCVYCTSGSPGDYHADKCFFSRIRPGGVSGILRVKDDAEFIAESIDSCIDALDELIIVYNGCTDGSPDIIKKKAVQYGDKIKYFEYKPAVYANNLTGDEYDFVRRLPPSSPHLLANYYNYALSKVSYKFVMKIDADQIYRADELKIICDAYREKKKKIISPANLLCFFIFSLGGFIGKRFGINTFVSKKWIVSGYRDCLLRLVSNYKLPVSFSGVNLFYINKDWFVTLGRRNEPGINILPPYNGCGDHIIFRLTAKTYFVPHESVIYTRLNSHSYSVIEVLQGIKHTCPFGIMWMHLNAVRRTVYYLQTDNFNARPEDFFPISQFVNTRFSKINYSEDPVIFPKGQRFFFLLIHDAFLNNAFMKFVQQYTLRVQGHFVLEKIK